MAKEIISFILSLVLLTSFFSFNVNADYDTDSVTVTETENQRLSYAADLLCYIGILDANDISDMGRLATRGQFAIFIAKMLKIEFVSTECKYSDITDEKVSGAVDTLSSMGIFQGYEDGTFRPDEKITVSQMLSVALRTLGYKYINNSNECLSIASRERLTKNISAYGNATMADCIVLLYNTLHTSTVVYVGNEEHEDDSLLEIYYGLWYVKGQVTTNEYTGFDDSPTYSPNIIKLDNALYYTENTEIGNFLGYYVTAYYDIESKSIVYFIPDDSVKTIKISSDEFDNFTGNKLNYTTEEGKKKSIKLESDAVIIKNSKLVETNYENAFNMDFGTVECISNDGKYNVVIISSYRNYVVKSIDISNRIIYTDKYDENGDVIKIELDGKDYVKFVSIPYGKEVNENTIQPDDIISVSMSDDAEVIRGYLCTERVTGKIEKSSAEDEITINGVLYKLDPELLNRKTIEVGDSGTFILDFSGRICESLSYNPKANNIGYIYRLFEDDDGVLSAKIFNTTGEHIAVNLAGNLKYDGRPKSDKEAKTALCTLSGGALNRQLIMYSVNNDGEINAIDTAAASKNSREKDGTLYTLLANGAYYWYYQMKSFDRKYVLSGNTYYMRVPTESSNFNDSSLFGCQKFSAVTWYNQSKTINILGLYKFDEDSPFADILLVGNTDGATLTNQTEITVVSSVQQELHNDEAVVAIHGYRRGLEVTAYLEPDKYNNDVEEGDIIRFVNKVDGYVGNYELIYNQSEDKILWNMTSTADAYTSNTASVDGGLRYSFGYVNKLFIAPYTTGLNSVIEIGAQPGETDDIYQIDTSSSASTRFIVFDKDRQKDKVYMGHLDEIISHEDSNSFTDTSRVFVHARSGWVVAFIIYK